MTDPKFPRVTLNNNWRPWDDPSFVPRGPHNLPAPGQRPNFTPHAGMGPAPTPAQVPTSGPLTPSADIAVTDPHHYARMIEGTFQVPTQSTPLGLFLASPSTRRNMLILRNLSQTDGVVFVSFGNNASANSTIRLAPNTMVLFDAVVPQDDAFAFFVPGATDLQGVLAYTYSTIAG